MASILLGEKVREVIAARREAKHLQTVSQIVERIKEDRKARKLEILEDLLSRRKL